MIDLSRPIVALDLEATSTDPTEARIIQVGANRYVPGEGLEADRSMAEIVNPGIPVDPRVQELTGLSQEQIESEGRPWPPVADALGEMIADADLVGYNIIGYDYPLLEAEYGRLNRGVPGPEDRSVVDAYSIERQLNPRTLENVYKSYTGEALEGAHDASADVEATWRVLMGQCATYDLQGLTPSELENRQRGDYLDADRKLKRREDGSVEVCFGKHGGKTVEEIARNHPDYLRWVYGEITELQEYLDEIVPEIGAANCGFRD